MSKEVYDVYYSTGGGSLVGGGADVWVNHWIENITDKHTTTDEHHCNCILL